MTHLHHLIACTLLSTLCLSSSFWLRHRRSKLYDHACERANSYAAMVDRGFHTALRSELVWSRRADVQRRPGGLELLLLIAGSILGGFAARLLAEVMFR